MKGLIVLPCWLVLLTGFFQGSVDADDLTFEQHVRPILKAQCFHCHGEEEELHGGLDLRLVRLMVTGGDSGEAIIPGDAESSLLWQRVVTDEMPEGSKKLSAEQKATLRKWIESGARTARPEPSDVRDARFTQEELAHWAFQPVKQPALPPATELPHETALDLFIAERLQGNGLSFSPKADRQTLIRRLSFSLLGLPPSPEEVTQFVNDEAPDAYERLVDRLLASPQFGVRWGRHWLDVAGYAESNGDQPSDGDRPHAWRYRDYVVDAFNASRPVDRFYTEQLAGDELIKTELDIHNPEHLEMLTATGFLRMSPDRTQTTNTLEERTLAVAESLKVVSSAMIGMTVGCAQCHDHKYDPIGIDDYYRFRAIFDPVFPMEKWATPASRVVDFTTTEVLEEEARIEAEAKAIADDIQRRRTAHGQKIQDQKLTDVPDDDREATRTAVLTESTKRNDEQIRLLKKYPMVKPVSTISGGLLIEYDMAAHRRFKKEMEKVAAVRAQKPARRIVMVTQEQAKVVPVSHVLFRGNPESKGEEVSPDEVMVFRQNRDITFANKQALAGTTGRRLTYAQQLTDGTHPLTARVYVNRIWMHHMGQGIVTTPGDFGLGGAAPTHPELLDWLADDFVKHGWDPKRLHRQILLSYTFQQSSTRTNELDAIDPENKLYGRMSLRRLEAEAIRDSILASVDQLSHDLGGPSIPVVEAPDGKVVIGKAQVRDGLKTGVSDGNDGATRRSIYIQIQRRLPLNMLATFDQPVMNPNCEIRSPSTVATQSLWFLNDDHIISYSLLLAERLDPTLDDESKLEALFLRLFSQPPNPDEKAACLELLAQQRLNLKSENDDSEELERKTWGSLCQMLFASNRFLYVD